MITWSLSHWSLWCQLTGLTTDGWWPLPWTVGEQLPGVSSCRIGSEWQCGNTGNTGNPWQGQTKSWEAARAQGPAPAMGSLRLCCPRSPHSEAGPRPHSASADSVQARAASSMWPGARGLVWQSALSCSELMSHVTMPGPDNEAPDHWPPSWWCLLWCQNASKSGVCFSPAEHLSLTGGIPLKLSEAESLSGCIIETSFLEKTNSRKGNWILYPESWFMKFMRYFELCF